MRGLGNTFDVGIAWTPVDFNTSDAATGKRIHMRNYQDIEFLLVKAVGTAGADGTLTIQEHTANTGGTSRTILSGLISEYYKKEAATLAGTEQWAKVTQTAAGTVVLTTSADKEGMYVVHVSADSLSADAQWISVNIAGTVANAQLICGLYIMTGLKVMREPQLLPQPNA